MVAVAVIATVQPVLAAMAAPHTEAASTALALNHGEKWPTDQKLRQYMSEMQRLLIVAKRSMADGNMVSHDYQMLGAAIEGNVLSIFANCELEPGADANLHIIIGEFLGSVAALKGDSPAKAKSGVTSAIAAANRYGYFFSHPDWRPIR